MKKESNGSCHSLIIFKHKCKEMAIATINISTDYKPILDRCNIQCANLTAVGSDVNILDKRSSPKYTEITVPIFHIIKNGNGVMC